LATGVVLTKLDGDARGAAGVGRIRRGVPIAFVGSGERLEDLEPFHPDRIVSRVLGMGDVLSLIERASGDRSRRRGKARRDSSERIYARRFPDQLKTIRKMGPLERIMGMLPGFGWHEGAGGEQAG
jgi:signal recognition particle subunit SRP54